MKRLRQIVSRSGRRAALPFDQATIVARDVLADGWSLGAALIRAPRRVGAIAPSGKFLSDAMAREIPGGDGLVIELGGGTGAVTAGLVRAGIAASRLVVVERDPRLCERLHQRFPQCTIICGDACELPDLLIRIGIQVPVRAVVSCLPILAMSRSEQDLLIAGALRATGGLGPVVQFTYGLRCPVPAALLTRFGAIAERRAWIWRNVPPASVWILDIPGLQIV